MRNPAGEPAGDLTLESDQESVSDDRDHDRDPGCVRCSIHPARDRDLVVAGGQKDVHRAGVKGAGGRGGSPTAKITAPTTTAATVEAAPPEV